MRHLLETDGDRFWLGLDEDRPVGFGVGWVRGRSSCRGGLFVLPEWQGKGAGGRLFGLAPADLPTTGRTVGRSERTPGMKLDAEPLAVDHLDAVRGVDEAALGIEVKYT